MKNSNQSVVEMLTKQILIKKLQGKIDHSLDEGYSEIGRVVDEYAWELFKSKIEISKELFMHISELESKLEHSKNIIVAFFVKLLDKQIEDNSSLKEIPEQQMVKMLSDDAIENIFDSVIDKMDKYAKFGRKLSGRQVEKNRLEFYNSILDKIEEARLKGKKVKKKEIARSVFRTFKESMRIEGHFENNYKAFMKYIRNRNVNPLLDFEKK